MQIDARVGRPPVINSEFPAIIILEHRAKTPRTKKKKEKEKEEKNLVPKPSKTPFPPPHSDIGILADLSAETNFSGTEHSVAIAPADPVSNRN